MGLSIWQVLIVVLLLVLLFGRGKISELMGDMAKGIKSFKKGMAEDEEEAAVAQERTDGRHVSDHRAGPIDVTPTRAAERSARAVDESGPLEAEERKRDSA